MGNVTHDKGRILVGARVESEGTESGGFDNNGKFELLNLLVGIYTVKCSYIGFESVIMKNIKVEEGKPRELIFKMSMGGVVLDTMVIISERKPIDNSSGKIIGSEFIDNTGIRELKILLPKLTIINLTI